MNHKRLRLGYGWRTVLVLTFVLFTGNGTLHARSDAPPPQSSCAEQIAGASLDEWVQRRRRLESDLRGGQATLDALAVSADVITGVGKNLGSGAHGSVIEVQTEAGTMALKVYHDPGWLKNPVLGIAIQKTLGEVGLAPAVVGFLSKAEMARLTERFPEIGNARQGMLMRKINQGQSLKGGQMKLMAATTEAELRERLATIARILGMLRVSTNDLDFMITERNELILVDMEYYQYTSETWEAFTYSQEGPVQGAVQPEREDPAHPEHRFLQPEQFPDYFIQNLVRLHTQTAP